MVRRSGSVLLLAALLLDVLFIASPASSKPSTISIGSVVVVKTGVYTVASKADSQVAKSCSSMSVSSSRVALWFKHAIEVPKDGFQERAIITGCSLSGYLITSDGKRCAWDLDVGGAGVIYTASKEDAIRMLGPEISIASH